MIARPRSTPDFLTIVGAVIGGVCLFWAGAQLWYLDSGGFLPKIYACFENGCRHVPMLDDDGEAMFIGIVFAYVSVLDAFATIGSAAFLLGRALPWRALAFVAVVLNGALLAASVCIVLTISPFPG